MKIGRTFLFTLCSFACSLSFAQVNFVRNETIPVINGLDTLVNPWTGGLNFCQFSEIDLNLDGILDLFVFDRQGNYPGRRVTTFLNTGTPNKVSYVHAPQYEAVFNQLNMHDWALLRDYDCDGKADIFTYNNGSITVYHNTSTVSGGLSFALETLILRSYYGTTSSSFLNLYVSPVDIPAIVDFDNDGDLDVITYELAGQYAEYHKNLTMETYGICDSLNQFHRQRPCLGFYSDGLGCNNYITQNLGSCNLYGPPHPSSTDTAIGYPKHSGTCLMCLSEHGSTVKDLVIGHVSCFNLTEMKNVGDTATAHFNGIDYTWPSYNIPVNMNIFPCGFLLDVDNDGKKDVLCSPNQVGASENSSSIWYYKNSGSNDSVVLNYQQNNLLQDNMIDVGEGAYPVLHDYDGDGLADLFVGNYGYFNSANMISKIALFKNTGTATNPRFILVTRDFANLSSLNLGITGIAPAFGDLDGDGDADMIIGEYGGGFLYFEKVAGPPDAFVYHPNYFSGLTVGQFSAPQLIDMNADGLLDIVSGSRSGKVFYFQNTGTTTTPVFSSTPTSNFFGGVSTVQPSFVTGYSTPFFYKEAGSFRLLVGMEAGYIYKYNNIDNNLGGNFTRIDSTVPMQGQHIIEGSRSAPYGYDIDGDGLMDLFVGNYSGGVEFYKGDNTVGVLNETPEALFDFNLYPNPASDLVNLTIKGFRPQDKYVLSIHDLAGRMIEETPITRAYFAISETGLSSGVYVCKLRSENGVVCHKLVIHK